MIDKNLYMVSGPMNGRKPDGQPYEFKIGEKLRKTGESDDKRTIRVETGDEGEIHVDSEAFRRATNLAAAMTRQ